MGSLIGIITRPSETAMLLKERRSWFLAFLVTALILAVVGYVTYPFLAPEIVDRMEQQAEKQGTPPEQLEMSTSFMTGPIGRVIVGIAIPVIGLLLMSLLFSAIMYGLSRLFQGEGSWKAVLGLVMHGRFIGWGLDTLARLPLIYAKKSVMGVSLSLAALFPSLQPASRPFAFLSIFSIFNLWFLVVLVLGMEKICGLNRRNAFVAAAVTWLIEGVLLALQQSSS